jgi:S-DNA-T family DNA segregation ATPase FtsK/SpoIIIE
LKKATRKTVTTKERTHPPKKFLGVVWMTLAILIFFSFLDYQQDQINSTNPIESNWVGQFGSHVGYYGFHYLGAAVWIVPFLFGFLGYRFFYEQKRGLRLRQGILAVVSVLSLSGLVAIVQDLVGVEFLEQSMANKLTLGVGGLVGNALVFNALKPILGPFGCILIFSVSFASSLYVGLGDNLSALFKGIFRGIAQVFQASFKVFKTLLAWIYESVLRLIKGVQSMASAFFKIFQTIRIPKVAPAEKAEGHGIEGVTKSVHNSGALLDQPIDGTGKISRSAKAMPEPEPESEAAHVATVEKKPPLDPASFKIIKGEKTEKAVASIPERRGDYVFPNINLLNNAPAISGYDSEDHAATMKALVDTLEQFGVKVIPGEIFTGPVITRYEVTPAAGVRVEKIVNLDKNIALGLKALSVRILAPVPGKGTVGIEVPNRISQAVCMRDIIESKSWAEAKAEIPIVLGKDVTGKPMVADLTKMPHVLIAGSTGSGKTVCINAIIASLLYHSGPEDLRFIMVDPKVVEMQLYNALPHMLIPVVTEPKKVPGALKWLIAEMDRRYQIFAQTKVRNIAGFNAKISKDKEEQERAKAMEAEMTAEERAAASQIEVPRDEDAFEIPKKKLPYIVCIIDELADLMMVAPADIETGIARIAQLARAAGIHLILATQRPSVNVITGVIKANLPSRISFKVASKVDSRTILDGGGAESLIGKGDMLFIPPGTSNLVRAQGAFVSDDEINGIVDFLKEKNDPPVFAEAVQKQIDSSDEEGGVSVEGGDDAMLNQALEVLKASKRASTSMLQRRLRIGYNRAARLMEELEERGVVGPENGSSPREILVDLDLI